MSLPSDDALIAELAPARYDYDTKERIGLVAEVDALTRLHDPLSPCGASLSRL